MLSIDDFANLTGFRPKYRFFMKVILPMYKAAPDIIDKRLFCKMFTRHSLELSQKAWEDRDDGDDE